MVKVYTVKHKVVGGSRWVSASGNSGIVSDTATPLTISGAEEIQVVAQVNAGTEGNSLIGKPDEAI